jgi:hypothetical protein
MRHTGSCAIASTRSPTPPMVGTIREHGTEVALPRGATANPTRTTVGVIEAMPHYAGYSVGAVHAVRPAREIVAELAGTGARHAGEEDAKP